MYRSTPGIIVFVLFISTISGLCGQEAILSSGSDASGTGGNVAYSVGQAAYAHFSSQEGQVSLGVQQPYLVIVVGNDDPVSTISVVMYPNPVKTFGVLELSGQKVAMHPNTCSCQLYDIFGRLLLQQDIVDHTTHVPMEQFENAVYFLKVICQNAEIKTFKVIKTN